MIVTNNKWFLLFMIAFCTAWEQSSGASGQLFSGVSDPIGLEEILNRIKQEKQANFIYKPAIVQGKQINASLYDPTIPLEILLARLLDPIGLDFEKLDGNTYVIKKKVVEKQASIQVMGTVTSAADGEGLPGVNVYVKGTTIGAITNVDGSYSLEVPSQESILVFSSIGFIAYEIVVGNQSVIDVVLEMDITELSEVVVTAVGIETNKSELGYSIQNLDPNDVISSRETNLVSALSGKVAGVQITSSSGSPGSSATIRIRGNRSVNLDNDPLFVIDGLPIDNSTSANGSAGVDVSNRAIDINPNDIEKITVLKGPAATVLYGSRAANGAIMITTKKGKVGKPIVTIQSSIGMSEVNKLPPIQKRYAQGRPSLGELVYRGPETGEAASYGPLISSLEFDGDSSYPYDAHGRLVKVGEGAGIAAKAYDVHDAFWVNGLTLDNNVSVIGGSEGIQYYISTGNLHQTGVVPHSDFTRTSVKANIDAKLYERLSVGVSSTYINSGGNRIQRGSNVSGATTGVFRNTPTFDVGNGLKGRDAAGAEGSYLLPDGTQRAYRGNALYDNPFWVVNKTPYEDDVNRFIGNINFNYNALPWLKFTYKLGLDRFTDQRDFSWDINSSSEPTGEVNHSVRISRRINSDFLVLIAKELSSKWSLNGTLGHNYFSDQSINESIEGRVLSVPGFYNISNASEIQSSKTEQREKYFGVYADVHLNYDNLIYLNVSGRNDWASTLPTKNNSIFYPSISTGFEFTRISRLSNSDILPYGKFRVSYGQVGNDPPIYSTATEFNKASVDGDGLLQANDFPAFGVNGFERSGLLGNQELKPELTSTFEIGGDFRFLKGRVGLDLTYYHASTDNQIVRATLPAPSGYTDIILNAGEVQNKGLEIVLSGSPIKANRVSWDASVNFTKNTSLVKSLPEGSSIALAEFTAVSSLNIVGYPYGILSGTRYKRNEEGQLIIGSDGWPLLAETQGPIGDPNPDWLMGVRNTLGYRNFSFSFLWDIRKGGDLWNGTKAVMDYLGTSKESGDLRSVTDYVFEGVTEAGEKNTVPVDFADPALGLGGIKWRRAGTLLGIAEDNIEDGSWMRLREVTLRYGFPASIFASNSIISSVDVSVYGRNLILITDYKGVDPETNLRGPSNDQGWDYFNLPGTRSYGFSLKMVLK